MLKIKLYLDKLLFLVLVFCCWSGLNQYPCISVRAQEYTLAESEREAKYYRAVELVNQGYPQSAIALWRELLQSTPDSELKARINLNLTITYLLRGDWHLASESYQEAQKYGNDTLSRELTTVAALMALATKDWDKAIALYSTLELANLTILNNLIESYQGRVEQRQKLALTARWEEAEAEEQSWLALAREDELKVQQLRLKAVEIASQEISLDAAKVFLRELQVENSQASAEESLQESPTENSQESSRENSPELQTENTQESVIGKTVSILEALKITEESIRLMVEVAQLNPDYWTQTEEMAVKLNNPDILASVWQAEAEYDYQQGNLAQALSLLNQANLTFSEEELSGNFSLYWTRARIYAGQGLWSESRDNYQLALDRVARIRFDLASGTRLNKEELLEQTSPLYKEYMAILLANPTQENLAKVIEVLQLFHLAELETHFAYPCELTLSEVNDSVQPESALIFNLVLADNLHQIVRFADGLQHKVIPLSQEQGKSLVLSFRQSLEFDASNEFRLLAAKLYDLLIRDWAEEFESRKIKKLTFINDAYYRNIPMAVLWDGDSYLIENYGINYSLGLELASTPEKLVNNPVIFASSKGSNWTPETLPFVPEEVMKITSIMGGDSYLNQEFSPQQLARKLQSPQYDILHLAGHARFSSFENSQFQTGTEPMSLSQFETLLRQRTANLQLLVLSGCQTAAGNDLAILGIAGIGVRNGIDSVVGGLWFASDQTSAIFIEHFYQSLLVASPSESLRNAQLELIKSPLWNHPRYWSNYILLY